MSKKDYLAVPAKKYKRLRVDGFFGGINGRLDPSLLPPSSAALSYNFDFSSGALKDGAGVEDIGTSGLAVTNIWRFVKNIDNHGEIIMFTGLTGAVYYLKDAAVHALGIELSGRVCTVCCRLHGTEAILMWGESGDIAVWDGVNSAYFITDSLRIRDTDTCGGLVFLADADGETVRYTDEPDPINWNSGYSGGALTGSVVPAAGSGRIGRLVSFSGYLYVFKDYGISRISISGDTPKAADSLLFSGRIFFDTVALCGGKIVFLSSDGLYEFDGLSAKRVLGNLTGIVPAPSACAAYHGGRYYLAAGYDWQDSRRIGCEQGEYTNNALIVYGLADGGYTLSRGMDITRIAAADDDVYVVCGFSAGRIGTGTVFGLPLSKYWESPFSDFGSEKTKSVKEIHIETSGDITLSVFNGTENGTEEKSFELKGAALPQRVRVALRGKKLGFSIESRQAGARVAGVVLVYSET